MSNLFEIWDKAEEGDILEMANSGAYPFYRFKHGTLGQFIDKELGNAIVNIERDDWIIREKEKSRWEQLFPKIKPDMYSHDSIVYEDEIILSYLNSFAHTIKLWVSSKQEIRIPATIDKFACILTAYMHGLKGRKNR